MASKASRGQNAFVYKSLRRIAERLGRRVPGTAGRCSALCVELMLGCLLPRLAQTDQTLRFQREFFRPRG